MAYNTNVGYILDNKVEFIPVSHTSTASLLMLLHRTTLVCIINNSDPPDRLCSPDMQHANRGLQDMWYYSSTTGSADC